MGLPIGFGEFVADQPVGGLGVGNAQQRLGQAHENHALARRQLIFVEEGVEAAASQALLTHVGDQAAGLFSDAPLRLRLEGGGGEKGLDGGGLVLTIGGLDGAARGIGLRNFVDQTHRHPRRPTYLAA